MSISCPQNNTSVQTISAIAFNHESPDKLDLIRHLISHPAATFFLQMEGDAMKEDGIVSGDTLIVDRALLPENNQIIIAELNGKLLIRHFCKNNKQIILKTSHPQESSYTLKKEDNFLIWGVVTASFRSY